jgi:hypothetical protein
MPKFQVHTRKATAKCGHIVTLFDRSIERLDRLAYAAQHEICPTCWITCPCAQCAHS